MAPEIEDVQADVQPEVEVQRDVERAVDESERADELRRAGLDVKDVVELDDVELDQHDQPEPAVAAERDRGRGAELDHGVDDPSLSLD